MKKLLVLPALGAAAALTYGAAAALNVNPSAAPIQVGEASLVCADGAEVLGWGYDDGTSEVFWAWVDITDDDFNCDGNTLYVTALGPNGEYLNRGSVKLGAPNYTARDTDDMEPCVLAGPTCDSADVLYEKNMYPLPISLSIGDEVLIEGTGAYTTTYSAVAFNGFEPLKAYVI